MNLPGFTADQSLYQTSASYRQSGSAGIAGDGSAIAPQFCVYLPCVSLPSGRICIRLPILGRRCLTIPNVGRWKLGACGLPFSPRPSLSRC